MLYPIILVVFTGLLIWLAALTYQLRHSDSESHTGTTASGFVYASLLLTIIVVLLLTWNQVKGTALEAHLMEWLNIIIRLMHITFGIAWIGASFYFVFLENALNRTVNVRDELAGNLWAVHGGGFYYLEKYKIAPKEIPKQLHWFKYEAYFTWLSGFSLLSVVYYFNANAMLIDPNVMKLSTLAAVSAGIGSLIAGWILYDLLCKSRIKNDPVLFALIGLGLITLFAWGYTHLFNARAAYVHFGALLGTIMAGNVFFVIIPAQKAMVKAGSMGLPLDPRLGKNALTRSLHNNYFTLPVLFVMISNHFPSTFGHEQPWLILMIITIGTAGIKHYLNLKEKNQLNIWIFPLSALILLSAVFLTSPPTDPNACSGTVSFSEVQLIMKNRCAACHSAQPTDAVYSSAPNGVMFDTPDQILRMKDKIYQRVVITKTMPQNNKTNITPEERKRIGCWINQGAGSQ